MMIADPEMFEVGFSDLIQTKPIGSMLFLATEYRYREIMLLKIVPSPYIENANDVEYIFLMMTTNYVKYDYSYRGKYMKKENCLDLIKKHNPDYFEWFLFHPEWLF